MKKSQNFHKKIFKSFKKLLKLKSFFRVIHQKHSQYDTIRNRTNSKKFKI